MDVEAGTKLGAQSCHVQTAHDPAVTMLRHGEVSRKINDEQTLKKGFEQKSNPQTRL